MHRLLVGCGLWALALAAAGGAQPNFSGTWKLDLKASHLQIKAPDSTLMTIEHQGARFSLTRTHTSNGKSDTATWKATIGGPATLSNEHDEAVKIKMSWEGDILVADMTITRKDGRQATNVVRYKLAGGGRTLIAEEHFRGQIVKYDNIWVMRKQ